MQMAHLRWDVAVFADAFFSSKMLNVEDYPLRPVVSQIEQSPMVFQPTKFANSQYLPTMFNVKSS